MTSVVDSAAIAAARKGRVPRISKAGKNGKSKDAREKRTLRIRGGRIFWFRLRAEVPRMCRTMLRLEEWLMLGADALNVHNLPVQFYVCFASLNDMNNIKYASIS
jgi:hypothetical protein